jgi:hypothetical protein
MRAILYVFARNKLVRMALIPAPKYGHTLLRSWSEKTSIHDHLVEA